MPIPRELRTWLGVPLACVSNEAEGLVSVRLQKLNETGHMHIDRTKTQK